MSKLTKSDIKRAMLRSFCYQWQSFNYETMQSAGFAQFITPAIKKIYEGDDELIAQKTEQYLSTFYNTENTMGQIIHGASLALEESETPEITETAVALRTGLMGPFAGLGDSIFKVSAKVIFGSLPDIWRWKIPWSGCSYVSRSACSATASCVTGSLWKVTNRAFLYHHQAGYDQRPDHRGHHYGPGCGGLYGAFHHQDQHPLRIYIRGGPAVDSGDFRRYFARTFCPQA